MNQTASQIDILRHEVGSRSKPALLVELTIIGQISLGNNTQDGATLHDNGTIIKQWTDAHRHTYHTDDIQLAGEVEQLNDSLLGLLEQQLLTEQILTSVTRDRQLREHDDLSTFSLSLGNEVLYLLNVIVHIGYAHTWYGSSHFD